MSEDYASYFYSGMQDAISAAQTEDEVIKQGSEAFKGVASLLGHAPAEKVAEQVETEEEKVAAKGSKMEYKNDDKNDDDEAEGNETPAKMASSEVDPLLDRLRSASAK